MSKNKKKFLKLTLIASLLLIFINLFPIDSKAAYDEFNGFNNAPRMTIQTNKNKYTDVNFIFTDNNGINEKGIDLYTINSSGNKTFITDNNKAIIKKESFNVQSSNIPTKWVYTLSNNFLNQKNTNFYLDLEDSTGQRLQTYFKILNNKKGYSVDYAPRIINWGTDGKNISFVSRDLGGTQTLLLKDLNNNNKIVISKRNLGKGNKTVTFKASKFKSKDGIYRINISATDKNFNISARDISFRLKDVSSNSTNSSANTSASSPTVTDVHITKLPNKTTYIKNVDELDLTGGEITVYFSDKTSKKYSMTNKSINVSGFSNNQTGTVHLKLTFKEKSADFTIQVVNAATTTNTNTSSANITPTKTLQGKQVTLPEGDKVYFLDVQDVPKGWDKTKGSDAIILESNGKFAMIDTGINDSIIKMASRVKRYLKELQVTELEFVMITHNHNDHDGGMQMLANSGIKIKTLYIKDIRNTKVDAKAKNRNRRTLSYAKKAGAKIYKVNEHKSTRFTFGNFQFELYNEANRNQNVEVTENINSIAAVATVNGKRIYFAGDIENIRSKNINAADDVAKQVGKVDIYKAAHHGYYYNGANNTPKSLSYIKPTYVVVTCSPKRRGVAEGIGKIKQFVKAKNIYCTADGTVILNIAPNGAVSFKKLKADG